MQGIAGELPGVLIDIAPVRSERLDAISAAFLVEPHGREERPCRIDPVSDGKPGYDTDTPAGVFAPSPPGPGAGTFPQRVDGAGAPPVDRG